MQEPVWKKIIAISSLALVFLFRMNGDVKSAELTVAVAANFTMPFEEIRAGYQERSGTKINSVFASTGTLYAQIIQGAPFDLFLAADSRRPEKLHSRNLAMKPFVYARGEVVLWSGRKDLALLSFFDVLTAPADKTTAAANPQTAPYGTAAVQALKELGLYGGIKKRLVYGQNVGQVFQYALSRAADSAFIAKSQALSAHGQKGRYWRVPGSRPIIQKGCLILNSRTKEVLQFKKYLESAAVRSIMKKYGYTM